jgi:FMN-dependent NADH-azoreductase
MKNLLHLDASATTKGSVSRDLTSDFARDWLKADPAHTVTYRDLNRAPVPVVTSDLLEAVYAPAGKELGDKQRAALETSDTLVEEFLAADAYVFGVPMYNFSVPGAFKAYMDQIIRVGRTVGRGPKGLEGLVKGRKMLIVATRAGDYAKGGPREGWDFHEPYLRRYFGWMGIEDLTYLPVINSANHGDQERRLLEAQEALQSTAERWLAEFEAEHGPDAAAAGVKGIAA